MPDLPAHELPLKRELQRANLLVHPIKIRLQPFNRLRHQILVRIQPQHPLRLNRQIVQRPVELHRLQPRPFMLDQRRRLRIPILGK